MKCQSKQVSRISLFHFYFQVLALPGGTLKNIFRNQRRKSVQYSVVPPGVASHIFRHTIASEMVNHGVSFKDVADVLGHQSIETTGIYAKLELDALAAVALPWGGDAL